MKHFVFAALFAVCLGGCWYQPLFDCDAEIKREVVSPDHRYIATWYALGCGATTPDKEIVNIRQSSVKFKNEGQVFVTQGSGTQINLVWIGQTSLQVDCSGCTSEDILKRESSWRDISISYSK